MATSTPPKSETRADYAVIGLGVSGLSCLRHLLARGASVLALDTRAAPPGLDAVRREWPTLEVVLGPLDASLLARCRHVVLSPGLSRATPEIDAAAAAGVEII
ncbi:MAG: UDP-N-acetylmuramoyl-L-alanine--D-glutamate ligase, partial [Gammaproteobacteria bacterium]